MCQSHLRRAQACNFIKKETLAQVFSCQFCENFKNTFFCRTPPVAASEILTTHKMEVPVSVSLQFSYYHNSYQLLFCYMSPIFFQIMLYTH